MRTDDNRNGRKRRRNNRDRGRWKWCYWKIKEMRWNAEEETVGRDITAANY